MNAQDEAVFPCPFNVGQVILEATRAALTIIIEQQ
jgi:hypothetical protein